MSQRQLLWAILAVVVLVNWQDIMATVNSFT